jgi:hypothetical protein
MLHDVPWIVILWPVLMLGVIVVAAVAKFIEVNNAKSWRSVPGVVVESHVEARKSKASGGNVVRLDGEGTETKNFANVVYEYELFGKKLRSNRVSIGEDAGNFEIEETLARYPVGTRVTVYYNPRRPREAVLERDAPKGLFGCLAWGVVILLVGYAFTLYGFSAIYDWLTSALGNPNRAGQVLALTVFGLVTALIISAIGRSVTQAKAWPVVPGRIERSEVESFVGFIGSGKNRKPQTLYRTNIVYAYKVGERTYRGTSFGTQGTTTANYRSGVDKAVARFKVGDDVKVHYDPKNPSQSLVGPRMPLALWLVWIVPIGCLAGAVYILTR